MQGITDRDIAYDMLNCCKHSSIMYCEAALESASPSCYRMFMDLHDRSQEFHRRIWEYLHRREEYRVSEAHPQEVHATRERMERLRDDHLRTADRMWERHEMEPAGVGANRGGFRGAEWSTAAGTGAANYGPTGSGFGSGNYGNPGNFGNAGGNAGGFGPGNAGAGYGSSGGYGTGFGPSGNFNPSASGFGSTSHESGGASWDRPSERR